MYRSIRIMTFFIKHTMNKEKADIVRLFFLFYVVKVRYFKNPSYLCRN